MKKITETILDICAEYLVLENITKKEAFQIIEAVVRTAILDARANEKTETELPILTGMRPAREEALGVYHWIAKNGLDSTMFHAIENSKAQLTTDENGRDCLDFPGSPD